MDPKYALIGELVVTVLKSLVLAIAIILVLKQARRYNTLTGIQKVRFWIAAYILPPATIWTSIALPVFSGLVGKLDTNAIHYLVFGGLLPVFAFGAAAYASGLYKTTKPQSQSR